MARLEGQEYASTEPDPPTFPPSQLPTLPSRAELETWDREHVWHAFTQMAEYQPLLIERAEGCTLYDIDGRAYIDGVSSLWCNVHGHRHPRLDAALREQLDRVAHVTNLGTSNSSTIRLAKRLTEIAPAGLNHVFFSGDGSSAVEVALKMSFQYWRQCSEPRSEKKLYVAFDEAYHGDTLGSVSVGGVDRFNAVFRPLMFEVLRLPPPTGADAISLMERTLAKHHAQIAAVVIEPLVQCAAGILVQPPGYLHALRELTRKYHVHLIADEVAVGFGRTGKMFACQHERVTPDFLCLAKGLTGGYLPMSATMTTDEIWQAFLGTYAESKTFFHGHTYGGNPLAAAVALASLEVFAEERTLESLPPKIARLNEHLTRIADLPHVGAVRQRGLIAGIELVRNRATGEPYAWTERRGLQVCEVARQHGVLLRPLGNVIVIMPPLAISLLELDQIIAAIEAGIGTLTE
jgi:adenosylmethionine-8-amino-7-oxononanoate aminotransferase